jgi:hypothetical protein
MPCRHDDSPPTPDQRHRSVAAGHSRGMSPNGIPVPNLAEDLRMGSRHNLSGVHAHPQAVQRRTLAEVVRFAAQQMNLRSGRAAVFRTVFRPPVGPYGDVS